MCVAIRLTLLLVCLSLGGNALTKVQLLEKVSGQLSKWNAGLGIYSRSKIVASVSRSLRGEDNASVREGLNQAIVTLAVLDIGGGVLAPIVSDLIEDITTESAFESTRNAWKSYGTPIVNSADELDTLTSVQLKTMLNARKNTIMSTFNQDVISLPQNHNALKHIRKAKRWLRVQTLGKVIGPVFDLLTIGVNGWALGTAIRDCVTTSSCNHGSIAAASLSIVSGLVGLVTFGIILKASAAAAAVIGPVGAIAAALLAISATLIELFYEPPPDSQAVARHTKEAMMKELDRYSRLQLYTANQFLAANDVERSDMYVVNQGHLPKFFTYSPRLKVRFGLDAAKRPRMSYVLTQQCSEPHFGHLPVPNVGGIDPNPYQCPYIVDGKRVASTSSSTTYLGYGLYGFTKNARTYQKYSTTTTTPPYEGTMIFVNTDKVQRPYLQQHNVAANLRGLDLNTQLKSGNTNSYNDLIAIGDMPSLDTNEKVVVRMGSGNDALNIDGRLGPLSRTTDALDADLGSSGHNTLSFEGMAANSPIKGIKFDAKQGILHYFQTSTDQVGRRVGIVRHVEILGASPFNDYIKMYANRSGDNGFDFTAIKFKGLATYEIDIAQLASQSQTRHFKIIDDTKGASGCTGHTPVLKLTNFRADAVANDILYKNEKVQIYGKRTSNTGKRSIRSLMRRVKPEKHHSVEKRQTTCSGEPANSHPKGGQNGKVLLATVTLYTKCPMQIQTKTSNGGCMMQPRTKSQLDLKFFNGKQLNVDFSSTTYTGTSNSDFATLKCPTSTVTSPREINLGRGSSDYLMISSELFLEPCGFDGVLERIQLVKSPTLSHTWGMQFIGTTADKFTDSGDGHILKGVDYIINEYGDTVVNLRTSTAANINLYDAYTEVTLRNVGDIKWIKNSNGPII